MKVIVSPNGEVIFETEDITQALDMVKALRNGAAPAKTKKRGPYEKKESPEEIIPVSPQLVEAWQWLVDNDTPTGAAVQEIAAGLGIKNAAANARLHQLVKKSLAYKVRRGYYRAGEAG